MFLDIILHVLFLNNIHLSPSCGSQPQSRRACRENRRCNVVERTARTGHTAMIIPLQHNFYFLNERHCCKNLSVVRAFRLSLRCNRHAQEHLRTSWSLLRRDIHVHLETGTLANISGTCTQVFCCGEFGFIPGQTDAVGLMDIPMDTVVASYLIPPPAV